jgi:hypothetical protein
LVYVSVFVHSMYLFCFVYVSVLMYEHTDIDQVE